MLILCRLNPNWPFTSPSGEQVPAGNGTLNMTDYFMQHVGLPRSAVPATLPALAPFMPWGPAIDGTSVGLLDVPLSLIKEGKFNKVPAPMTMCVRWSNVHGLSRSAGSVYVGNKC
jgi:hypothetical protein